MKLPEDIEFLVNDEGAFIEIESFIRFLKSDANIPEDYKKEAEHLKKLAQYLEEQFAEVLAQKAMLDAVFNEDMPN